MVIIIIICEQFGTTSYIIIYTGTKKRTPYIDMGFKNIDLTGMAHKFG